jgi:predicted DCC family thiol-disulfide oxidoreductase YuxK
MGAPSALAHSIVLFDGVCNLCSASVQFIIKRDKYSRFRFASLQSRYGTEILNGFFSENREIELYSIFLIEGNRIYSRSDAVLRIARGLKGGWPLLSALRIIPRFIRDPIYNLIARNRYRMFGKKDQCMIPTQELKARFID